jgi:hypothetical protein
MKELNEIKAIQNGVYIVLYNTTTKLGSYTQIEGVFAKFSDAENHANNLRDEAFADGDFLASVSVNFRAVY